MHREAHVTAVGKCAIHITELRTEQMALSDELNSAFQIEGR